MTCLYRHAGIPPHIRHSINIEKVIEVCGDVKTSVDELNATIGDTIREAIDDKVRSDGNVNISILRQELTGMRYDFARVVTQQIAEAGQFVSTRDSGSREDATVIAADRSTFLYDNSSWGVPQDFAFPAEVTLEQGWRKWFHGMEVQHEGQRYSIMPFRLFAVKDMPYDNLKQHFKNNWQPIFTRMTAWLDLELAQDYRPTDAELKKLFDDAMNQLKARFSFIFTTKSPEHWLISTWSKNKNPMYVRKHGTESDKEKLLPPHSY